MKKYIQVILEDKDKWFHEFFADSGMKSKADFIRYHLLQAYKQWRKKNG